jgi:hypothetical protein
MEAGSKPPDPLPPSPPADPDAAYERGVTSPGWELAVEQAPWDGSKETGWRKSMKCPRCGHFPLVASANDAVLVRGILPSTGRTVLARCACSGEHKNHPVRPNNDWGCGFTCLVALPESQ